jgi:predicted alpha/beta-fold hydrolase
VTQYKPHSLLRNAHLMTIAGALWRRKYPRLPPPAERFFEVEPGTQLLAHCHWQSEPRRHPTIVLVHGLEGSSDSGYMLGIADKAYAAGFNAVRVNQRNCGGSERLTPTLYNSGLSADYCAVLGELTEQDGLAEVFFAGYSMGGNLVLKMAGEFGANAPRQLRGVAAVCPALDLAASAGALEEPRNFIYEGHFVRGLKQRMRRKAALFPDRYQLNGLAKIHSVREFDEAITAPNCGYRDANDYYFRASAIRVAARIRIPTLILAAQDDPFVPYQTFGDAAITGNPAIQLEAPASGGHCAFITGDPANRFWAESRVVAFCRERSAL